MIAGLIRFVEGVDNTDFGGGSTSNRQGESSVFGLRICAAGRALSTHRRTFAFKMNLVM
jgi:hypothetical protein